MAWEVYLKKGLCLPQIGWWMDAQFSAQRSVVTHAHSDHVGRHKELICSGPTAQLMRERIRGKRIEHIIHYGKAEAITQDTSIKLHPAVHILGSSLVEMNN